MPVTKNTMTTIDYTLQNDAGDLIDTSKNHGPLSYLHGYGELIPGLEQAMEGKEKGEAFSITIPPDKGYGQYQDNLIFEIPKGQFQGDGQLQVGLQVQMSTNTGQQFIATIKEIKDDHVIVDGNHPLAGENLHFDIEIQELREASQEEIDQRLQQHKCHSGECHDNDCDHDEGCHDGKGGCHCH